MALLENDRFTNKRFSESVELLENKMNSHLGYPLVDDDDGGRVAVTFIF
jgi:hypothetical protein